MARCLTGEYEHKLDAKGRLIMPLKLREELGRTFMVTKGLDDCLFVYPNDEWERFAAELNELPLLNTKARALKRRFNSGAVKCDTDSQGRILLPQTLRDFAGIDKEVVIIGNGERAEIWSKESWEAVNCDEGIDMDAIAAELDTLGFKL